MNVVGVPTAVFNISRVLGGFFRVIYMNLCSVTCLCCDVHPWVMDFDSYTSAQIYAATSFQQTSCQEANDTETIDLGSL